MELNLHDPTIKSTCADWCFTLNNYTDADIQLMTNWSAESQCKMLVCAKEVGESGTPHFQGRIIFRAARRFSSLKKLHSRISWGMTKMQADTLYCMKEGSDVFINEDYRRQGGRSDLEAACTAASEGVSICELWRRFPVTMVRYHRGIIECRQQLMPLVIRKGYAADSFKRPLITDWSQSHMVLGPPGVGKTEWALAHFKRPLVVTHLDDLSELTANHDGIVFDDMDFCQRSRNMQIFLTDQTLSRSINIRYARAVIPPATRKLFVCNQECFNVEDAAVARRLKVHHVLQKVY